MPTMGKTTLRLVLSDTAFAALGSFEGEAVLDSLFLRLRFGGGMGAKLVRGFIFSRFEKPAAEREPGL